MMIRTITLAFLLCLGIQIDTSAVVSIQPNSENKAELTENSKLEKTSLKEKFQNFTDVKKAKIQKKLKKVKKKLDRKKADSSGVRLGLVIVVVGLLVAILGFAGIADLLVTIGLIVLVVGLVLWLLSAI